MPPKTKPAPKPAPAAPKPTQAVRSGREMAADFEQDGLKALEKRDWAKAVDGYAQAMELWEKYKEPLCLSRCAARLGECAYEQDDFAEALAQFSRQADFARKHKERAEAAHPLAVALYNVGLAQFRCGHFVDAEGTLKQAYEQARGVEDAAQVARAAWSLALMHQLNAKYEPALDLHKENLSVLLARREGGADGADGGGAAAAAADDDDDDEPEGETDAAEYKALVNIGLCELRLHRLDDALATFERAEQRAGGDASREARALYHQACAHMARGGDIARAARLLERAARLPPKAPMTRERPRPLQFEEDEVASENSDPDDDDMYDPNAGIDEGTDAEDPDIVRLRELKLKAERDASAADLDKDDDDEKSVPLGSVANIGDGRFVSVEDALVAAQVQLALARCASLRTAKHGSTRFDKDDDDDDDDDGRAAAARDDGDGDDVGYAPRPNTELARWHLDCAQTYLMAAQKNADLAGPGRLMRHALDTARGVVAAVGGDARTASRAHEHAAKALDDEDAAEASASRDKATDPLAAGPARVSAFGRATGKARVRQRQQLAEGTARNVAIANRGIVGLGPLYASGQKVPPGKALRKAMDNLTRALEVVTKSGDHAAGAALNGHMGCCKLALGAKKEALSNFEKALKDMQRSAPTGANNASAKGAADHARGMLVALRNMADVNDALGDERAALKFAKRYHAQARELGDRVASADGAKRLATLYVVFAQKGRANFKNETPLDAEALEAMGDARVDKEEEEDVRFLCINARQRALVFMKEYRALSEYFVWQNERLDWTQPVAKKKAF